MKTEKQILIDRLNHLKSNLADIKRPKMDKSYFNSVKIMKLEGEIELLKSEINKLNG